MGSYLGWGGKTLDVTTNIKLGRGWNRGIPRYGLRRVVWDVAFGYVSGFKGSAILYYVLTRSLNRRLSVWAMKREGIEFRDGRAVARREPA